MGLGLSGCAVLAPLDEHDGAPVEEDDDFGTVEVYTVLEDGSLDPLASGTAAHVWETFERVVTPDFAAETIAQFRVGDEPDSDTLAYVYQDRDPSLWVLAANLATIEDDGLLISTLVHEFAHILTLGPEQFDPKVASCDTLELDEGCAFEDSLLYEFERRFWAGYDDAPEPGNADADLAWEFYEGHEDDFVSDYAATNVVEDIAESFMTFVLEDQPEGDTVVAQKLDFFWEQPDLVALRERIRAEFGNELGLG
jgi:hypothetical protein